MDMACWLLQTEAALAQVEGVRARNVYECSLKLSIGKVKLLYVSQRSKAALIRFEQLFGLLSSLCGLLGALLFALGPFPGCRHDPALRCQPP
jgi:hypothetical protein